ncbi:alpha/beta hydrolase [Micromonospora sp. NBC_00898]|uniref:alpha/beta fold hydrolase n=1 Tax=Micromonospora sp. NBC_00898 TaxID=2975981 RepID=UPI00386C9E36|nr:alpha/beta hydrolase [Micromonospora sp. NBC_00898]
MGLFPHRDAEIFYEIHGDGPPLLLIPGGPGVSAVYQALGNQLADRWTVITYDLPGHGRSSGPRDRDNTVRDQADLAAQLLAHLGRSRSTVFGTSYGAVIAVDMLARHPSLVQALVVHEPIMIELLTDAPTWRAFFDQIIHAADTEAAFAQFMAAVHAGSGPGEGFIPPAIPPFSGGTEERAFSLRHELPHAVSYLPDIAQLARAGAPIAVLAGTESESTFYGQSARELACRLNIPCTPIRGGHLGHFMHPVSFAATLSQVMADLTSSPA